MRPPVFTHAAREVIHLQREVVLGSEHPRLDRFAVAACGLPPDPQLLTAIREAMKHRSYVTPLVTEGMLGALMHSTSDAGSRQLTSRQREVLQLLAEGKSMKEVGSILNVTPRTVAFHKYRMMEQLKIKTNAELIQYAIRNNLI